MKVSENDRRVPAKLPNDLPAGAARRRQCFRISNDGQLGKMFVAFRQRLPDRDAFAANSKAITGALNIASRVDFSVIGLHRGAHQEI